MDGFGLMDYNARYYDPLLGRFISPDTIIPQPGNPLAWDRYAYVGNDPLKFIDPSGHCGIICKILGMTDDIPEQTPQPTPYPSITNATPTPIPTTTPAPTISATYLPTPLATPDYRSIASTAVIEVEYDFDFLFAPGPATDPKFSDAIPPVPIFGIPVKAIAQAIENAGTIIYGLKELIKWYTVNKPQETISITTPCYRPSTPTLGVSTSTPTPRPTPTKMPTPIHPQ